MRIGLLGPVTAGPDGVPAPGGVLLRGALARLALDTGRVRLATDVLVDALWGTDPPDAVTNALQALVSRLRRALGAGRGRHRPGGYLLDVEPARTSTRSGSRSWSPRARAPRPGAGPPLLVEATALWRGPALADVRRLPFGDRPRRGWRSCARPPWSWPRRGGAPLGEPEAELDAELEALLVAEHPLRERVAAVLVRCLHADRPAGRGAGRLRAMPGPARRRAGRRPGSAAHLAAAGELAVLRADAPGRRRRAGRRTCARR